LDEMTNNWAVMWIIVIFVFMNVVLMNLLIAMMSNTCKAPSALNAVCCSRARSSRGRERGRRPSCALPATSWSRV
jgi:hypothetical protein